MDAKHAIDCIQNVISDEMGRVRQEYKDVLQYPSMKLKFDRDMNILQEAEDALGFLTAQALPTIPPQHNQKEE